MRKCKTKVIQADLSIFMHISAYKAYPGIIQTYLEPCITVAHSEHIQNPGIIRTRGIFRTLVYSEPEAYSEPWCIQNSGTFRTRGILRTLLYLEPWWNQRHIQNQRNPEPWYVQNSGTFGTRGLFNQRHIHIQNPGIFRVRERHSEPLYIHNHSIYSEFRMEQWPSG